MSEAMNMLVNAIEKDMAAHPKPPKERPILFSGPMVRAILAGTKTQTRRVMKPQPPEGCEPTVLGLYAPTMLDRDGYEYPGTDVYGASTADGEWAIKCPFGAPGDRLWVRETWRVGAWREDDGLVAIDYRATPEVNRTPWIAAGNGFDDLWEQSTKDAAKALKDNNGSTERAGDGFCWDHGDSQQPRNDRLEARGGRARSLDPRPCRWRPSIFMPRWASRLTLEVTDVRVERLQEITEKDALREGVEPLIHEGYTGYDPRTQSYPFAFERNVLERELCIEIKHQRQELATAKGQYETLWNSLNAKRGYGWDKNPWVWVVAFRRTNV